MRSNPERLAWRILLTAFCVFLLICGSLAYAVQWYLFQSNVPMDVELKVARGTAQIVLPTTAGQPIAVTDERTDLEAGVAIQTDGSTQAVVTFLDKRTGEPVASLVIFRDTQLQISAARAPRFGLNQNPYLVQAEQQAGRIEVLTLETGRRPSVVEVVSPHAFTRMSTVGEYFVRVTSGGTAVTTREGESLVVERSTGHNVTLPPDRQTFVREGDGEMTTVEAEHSALSNATFDDQFEIGWEFYNDREPPGEAYNATFDGRPVVVIDRAQSRWPDVPLSHGETGLVQPLDINATRYQTLELRATFLVAEQSLSTCGIAGSECAMMLHIRYIDRLGRTQDFRHGFYATHDPGLGYPVACDTCRSEHERINPETWYTYESGNLLTLFPASQTPAQITEVSFYASGHAYKVYVSEMNLLVGR